MRKSGFLVLFIAAFTACGGDSPTETVSPFVGNWTLRTLGATPVPITCLPINCPAYEQIGSLGIRVDVLGSALSIVDGANWSETLDLSVVTVTGTVRQSRTIYGSYIRNGALVHLRANADPAYLDCSATVETLTCDDGRARYTR